MTDQPLTIDASAMGVLVAKSIIDNLGDEQRDQLLQHAVEKIIAPVEHDNYGRKSYTPSLLQQAFDASVRETVANAVREYVDTPEIKAIIDEKVQEAIRTVIADKEGWTGRVALAVGTIVSDYVKGEKD